MALENNVITQEILNMNIEIIWSSFVMSLCNLLVKCSQKDNKPTENLHRKYESQSRCPQKRTLLGTNT